MAAMQESYERKLKTLEQDQEKSLLAIKEGHRDEVSAFKERTALLELLLKDKQQDCVEFE
eukprot:CAMPEP_0202851872 /NCGR_PEP_ID=MMETSP1389-20130828/87528_1 /ASSEMBLY_ACC=CAM_ASM_000865 /TAXON_ID=302021 /ORGANISM="Rhodomonas sp., Strain CCMP768" /LENGTH=59 /DNA_ID=CAMNT_0049530255 /DNA_START=1 /DNA_END=177 /DNA_ORIENTATION=+